MPHKEQEYSSVSNYPNNGSGASEAPGKQAAKFLRRVRCAADTCTSSRYHHHLWLGISVLTPLVYSVFFIAAYYETLPQLIAKADVNVYWTYNCTVYVNATEPFQEWTSTCEAGPIAKPVSEEALLSAANECSMNMTTKVPTGGAAGRFSVECVRQEGFETKTTRIPSGDDLARFLIFGGLAVSAYYLLLIGVYLKVRELLSNAVVHLESCSSCCSLDAPFGSSDHLPLVKWQLIRGSVRNHLILQAILAPLVVTLFVVTPTVAPLLESWLGVTTLASVLFCTHSYAGVIVFQSLGRKMFILKSTCPSDSLRDAAAIMAHYEEALKKVPFWY